MAKNQSRPDFRVSSRQVAYEIIMLSIMVTYFHLTFAMSVIIGDLVRIIRLNI
jgi:hypothetical protein